MIERLHLSALLLAAAALWGALLFLEGVAPTEVWLRPFSLVVGALMVLLALFDLFMWRWPLFRGWFVRRPDVRGTWRTTLESNWLDQGKALAPVTGYMVIRQTFSHISLRLMTSESRSEMLGAEVLRSDDGTYRIVGVYRNEPKLRLRDKSPIHNGGLVLQVLGAPPSRMEGTYWTDRKTSGDLLLEDRREGLVDDIVAAAALYSDGRT